MKKQISSRDIRCYTVPNPPQKEIEKNVQKANIITRTALCKMMDVDVYTK